MSYDCHVNRRPVNLELTGYNAQTVLLQDSRQEIVQRLLNASDELYNAIVRNDFSRVIFLDGYGININFQIRGRLPLELACEYASDEIVLHLYKQRRADPILSNQYSMNALVQACAHKRISVLKELYEMDKDLFVEFLDVRHPNYYVGRDVFRIIIDLDRADVLDEIIKVVLEQDSTCCLDSEDVLKMYNYAVQNNKQQCTVYLNGKWLQTVAAEQNLMQAILAQDQESLLSCIAMRVNVNKLINNEYPIELAVKAGNNRALNTLLDDTYIEWYVLTEAESADYDPRRDISLLAINHDRTEALELLFNHVPPFSLANHTLLVAIFVRAMRDSSYAVIEYTRKILHDDLTDVFSFAIAGDTAKLAESLSMRGNVNITLNGKTLLHVACEQGHIDVVNFLLGYAGVDANVRDGDGKYPISLACAQQNLAVFNSMVNSQIVRAHKFNDVAAAGYESALDVLKQAIDNDNVELLIHILRISQATHRFIYVNKANITALMFYAEHNQRTMAAKKLREYVHVLSSKSVIFDESSEYGLKALGDDTQGISHVERSFTISVERLMHRYGMKVESIPEKTYHKMVASQNLMEILSRLKRMIADVKDIVYPVYRKNPAYLRDQTQSQYLFDRNLTDDEYRVCALHTYNRLECSLQYSLGISGGYAWHSSWYNDDRSNLVSSRGITMGEIWCLAVLAAQDPNAVTGVYYSSLDIKDREQVLVRTLVECNRAYAYTGEKYIDDIGVEHFSCDHGVAVRGLLCLCGLHDDINIHESPLEWAYSVARTALVQVYQQSAQRELLDVLLPKHKFQLTLEEDAIVTQFYVHSRQDVANALLSQIGLLADKGYMTTVEYEGILEKITDIEVPVEQMRCDNTAQQVKRAPDFTRLDLPVMRCINKAVSGLQQEAALYKLPPSSDAAFGSLCFAAQLQNINVSAAANVTSLRMHIADVIEAAIIDPKKFEEKYHAWVARCHISGISPIIVIRTIQQKLVNINIIETVVTEDPQVGTIERLEIGTKFANYIRAIRYYANIDAMGLIIASALFGAPIACYDLQGIYIQEMSGAQIFLRPISMQHLNISCRAVRSTLRINIDTHICNAIIPLDAPDDSVAKLLRLGITNEAEREALDQQLCAPYEVMLGRDVESCNQIAIPHTPDNLILAILMAAKAAYIDAALLLSGPDDLRQILPDQQTTIGAVLNMLANFFAAKFLIYHVGLTDPDIYGDSAAPNTLKFYSTNGYLNVLVMPNSWSDALKLEQLQSRMTSDVSVVEDAADPQIDELVARPASRPRLMSL